VNGAFRLSGAGCRRVEAAASDGLVATALAPVPPHQITGAISGYALRDADYFRENKKSPGGFFPGAKILNMEK
jgi:hypothetical protein